MVEFSEIRRDFHYRRDLYESVGKLIFIHKRWSRCGKVNIMLIYNELHGVGLFFRVWRSVWVGIRPVESLAVLYVPVGVVPSIAEGIPRA